MLTVITVTIQHTMNEEYLEIGIHHVHFLESIGKIREILPYLCTLKALAQDLRDMHESQDAEVLVHYPWLILVFTLVNRIIGYSILQHHRY